MRNKKGFTLIELLAVIVVLGIILAIAIPKVTETIEASKKGSFELSVKNYIKTAQNYVVKQKMNNINVYGGKLDVLDIKHNDNWDGYWESNDDVITFLYIIDNGNKYYAENATNDSISSSKLTSSYIHPAVLDNDNGDVTIADGIITGYNGNHSNIIIPSGITSFGEGAFNNMQLESVHIPSSVSSIGEYAFAYNNLTSISIPKNTTVNPGAFMRNQLINVVIGEGAILNEAAFASALADNATITISEGVTFNGGSIFHGNRNLTIINKGGNLSWDNQFSSPPNCSYTIGESSNNFTTGSCSYTTLNDETATVTIIAE